MRRTIFCLILLGLLSGCTTWWQLNKRNYEQTASIQSPAAANTVAEVATPAVALPVAAEDTTQQQVVKPTMTERQGESLLVRQNVDKLWAKVNASLKQAGFKVLAKDKSLGTYYVWDSNSTAGKISKDTPIYQVRLQRQGNDSVINIVNEQEQPATVQMGDRVFGQVQKVVG